MEIFQAVEVFTQIITYVMIVSGIPPCIHMCRTGDTRGLPYPFFLAGLVNALFSVWYGYVSDLLPILQMNAISAAFNLFFIAAYNVMSKSKRQPLVQLSACISVVLAVSVYIVKFVPRAELLDALGRVMFLGCGVLLLTPLLAVRACMASKDTASISTVMAISGFLCSSSWVLYGLLLKDVYIYAPNMIGVFSNFCQFVCLAVYTTSTKKSSKTD